MQSAGLQTALAEIRAARAAAPAADIWVSLEISLEIFVSLEIWLETSILT
jgi:hypothetical protein